MKAVHMLRRAMPFVSGRISRAGFPRLGQHVCAVSPCRETQVYLLTERVFATVTNNRTWCSTVQFGIKTGNKEIGNPSIVLVVLKCVFVYCHPASTRRKDIASTTCFCERPCSAIRRCAQIPTHCIPSFQIAQLECGLFFSGESY